MCNSGDDVNPARVRSDESDGDDKQAANFNCLILNLNATIESSESTAMSADNLLKRRTSSPVNSAFELARPLKLRKPPTDFEDDTSPSTPSSAAAATLMSDDLEVNDRDRDEEDRECETAFSALRSELINIPTGSMVTLRSVERMKRCLRAVIKRTRRGSVHEILSCGEFLNNMIVEYFTAVFNLNTMHILNKLAEELYELCKLFIEFAVLKFDDDDRSVLLVLNDMLSPQIKFHASSIRTATRLHIPEDQKRYARSFDEREPCGSLVDFLNFFGQLGGFDRVQQRYSVIMERPVRCDLIMLSLCPYKNSFAYLTPDTISTHILPMCRHLYEFLSSAGADSKFADLMVMWSSLYQLSWGISPTDALTESIECAQLDLIFAALRSTALLDKIEALRELGCLLSCVVGSASTRDRLRVWWAANGATDALMRIVVYNESLLERAEASLRLLAEHSLLTRQDIESVWSYERGRMSSVSKTVCTLLARLTPFLDAHLTTHLLDVCVRGCWPSANEAERARILAMALRVVDEDAKLLDYVLEFVWDLAADDADPALAAFMRIVELASAKARRVDRFWVRCTWLVRCVRAVPTARTLVPLKLMRALILSFDNRHHNPSPRAEIKDSSAREDVVLWLCEHEDALRVLVADLRSAPHAPNLDLRLSLLATFVFDCRAAARRWINLEDDVWSCVIQGSSPAERDALFEFVGRACCGDPRSSSSSLPQPRSPFLDLAYSTLLSRLDPGLFTIAGVHCLERLLRAVHFPPGCRDESGRIAELVRGDAAFPAHATLWALVADATDDVSRRAAELLREIHTHPAVLRDASFVRNCLERIDAAKSDAAARNLVTLLRVYVLDTDRQHVSTPRTHVPLGRNYRGLDLLVTLIPQCADDFATHQPPPLIQIHTHKNASVGDLRALVTAKLPAAQKVELRLRNQYLRHSDNLRRLCELVDDDGDCIDLKYKVCYVDDAGDDEDEEQLPSCILSKIPALYERLFELGEIELLDALPPCAELNHEHLTDGPPARVLYNLKLLRANLVPYNVDDRRPSALNADAALACLEPGSRVFDLINNNNGDKVAEALFTTLLTILPFFAHNNNVLEMRANTAVTSSPPPPALSTAIINAVRGYATGNGLSLTPPPPTQRRPASENDNTVVVKAAVEFLGMIPSAVCQSPLLEPLLREALVLCATDGIRRAMFTLTSQLLKHADGGPVASTLFRLVIAEPEPSHEAFHALIGLLDDDAVAAVDKAVLTAPIVGPLVDIIATDRAFGVGLMTLLGFIGLLKEVITHTDSAEFGARIVAALVNNFLFTPAMTLARTCWMCKRRSGDAAARVVPLCTTITSQEYAFRLLVELSQHSGAENLRLIRDALVSVLDARRVCDECAQDFASVLRRPTLLRLPTRPFELWNRAREPGEFVGMKNAGATCYMNSVVQKLFMIEPVRRIVLAIRLSGGGGGCYDDDAAAAEESATSSESERAIESDSGGSVSSLTVNASGAPSPPSPRLRPNDTLFFRYFQQTFAALLRSSTHVHVPARLWTSFMWMGQPLNLQEQQDAVEFFTMLVDRIDDAFRADGLPPLLARVLAGVTETETRCCVDARHRSARLERFVTFSIEVIEFKGLEHALDAWAASEIMEGDNSYSCSECGRNVTARRSVRIKKCAPLLVFHLKRFTFDYDVGISSKHNDRFEFPRRLSLAAYMSDDAAGDAVYDLTGVVVHSGVASGGHYYSYIRTDGGRWYKFDDTEVTMADIDDDDELDRACFGGNDVQRYWCAYMLFYQRRCEQADVTLPLEIQRCVDGFDEPAAAVVVAPDDPCPWLGLVPAAKRHADIAPDGLPAILRDSVDYTSLTHWHSRIRGSADFMMFLKAMVGGSKRPRHEPTPIPAIKDDPRDPADLYRMHILWMCLRAFFDIGMNTRCDDGRDLLSGDQLLECLFEMIRDGCSIVLRAPEARAYVVQRVFTDTCFTWFLLKAPHTELRSCSLQLFEFAVARCAIANPEMFGVLERAIRVYLEHCPPLTNSVAHDYFSLLENLSRVGPQLLALLTVAGVAETLANLVVNHTLEHKKLPYLSPIVHTIARIVRATGSATKNPFALKRATDYPPIAPSAITTNLHLDQIVTSALFTDLVVNTHVCGKQDAKKLLKFLAFQNETLSTNLITHLIARTHQLLNALPATVDIHHINHLFVVEHVPTAFFLAELANIDDELRDARVTQILNTGFIPALLNGCSVYEFTKTITFISGLVDACDSLPRHSSIVLGTPGLCQKMEMAMSTLVDNFCLKSSPQLNGGGVSSSSESEDSPLNTSKFIENLAGRTKSLLGLGVLQQPADTGDNGEGHNSRL